MTNRSYLDVFLASAETPLSCKLLEAFCGSVRDPAVGTADYATRLKTVMEESLQDEVEDAPAANLSA